MRRIAAIDVGTNSTLLTIAEKNGRKIKPVIELATITRLGKGLGKTKQLSKTAIKKTLRIIKQYVKECRKNQTEEIYVIGTAALRNAKNSGKFIALLRKTCGLDIEIISGKKEAELVYKSVEVDFGKDVAVVDIGGGSTEIIIPVKYPSLRTKRGDPSLNFSSLSIGCVTLHEKHVKSDPINETDYKNLLTAIKTSLKNYPRVSGTKIVATAGTATTLGAMKLLLKKYNHSKVHGLNLTSGNLKNLIDKLKALTIKEREKLTGLQPERADIILPGAIILQEIMNATGSKRVKISDKGVRWGVVYEKFRFFRK